MFPPFEGLANPVNADTEEEEIGIDEDTCIFDDLLTMKFPISSGIEERQKPTDAQCGFSLGLAAEVTVFAFISDPLALPETEEEEVLVLTFKKFGCARAVVVAKAGIPEAI
jgi:hypothetical protein